MPLFHAVQHRLQDIENGAWRNSRKNLAGNYHGLELMYLLHNAMVQCLVPKEQLLVVDVFHQDNQQIYDTVRRFLGPELAKGTATGPLDPKVWHDKGVQTNEAQQDMVKELHRRGRLQTAMKLQAANTKKMADAKPTTPTPPVNTTVSAVSCACCPHRTVCCARGFVQPV